MTRSLAAAITVASAFAIPAGASDSGQSSKDRRSCPVTIPSPAARGGSGFDAASFNYGNDKLRAHLGWPRGRLPAGRLPDGGAYATIGPDGSISAKVGWWRGVAGTLVISGRRLDAAAPPLRAHVPEGYGPRGITPSGLTFPTVGCWRVTGKVRPASLTFVVKVEKVKPA